jgi:hypothetical protein
MSSKLNIGSVIWNATTGVEVGTILHSNALKTVNGTSLVGSGDLGVNTVLLATRTGTGAFTITPSKGVNSILLFIFKATGVTVPTMVIKFSDVSTAGSFNRLFQGSTEVCAFHKTSDTQITINTMVTGNFYVYEMVVG